jgi:hypothetical protein
LQTILAHKEQHRIQMQEKQGQLPPGAAAQTAGMMEQAEQNTPPNMVTIQTMAEAQQQQNMLANQAIKAQGQVKAEAPPPQPQQSSDKLPKEPAQPGPKPKNPAAPAKPPPQQQTSPAFKGGMQ